MKHKLYSLIIVFIALFIYCTSAFAVVQNESIINKLNLLDVKSSEFKPSFKVNLELKSSTLEYGSKSSVYFNFIVPENYYLYKDKISITSSNPEINIFKIVYPEAETKFDIHFNKEMLIYSKDFKIELPIELTNKISSDKINLHFDVKFQGCSKKVCFLPQNETLSTSINVKSISTNHLSLIKVLNDESKVNFSMLVKDSLFFVFLLVFLGGILTSLTPCIFPMIPITVGIIGAKNTNSKLQAFSFSAIYVLGIAITYSILGVVAGMTGSILGSILQANIVMYIIALIFILMGLSMLDVFYFQAPISMQNKLSRMYRKQTKGTYIGVFAMGLISGLIATPCVAPIIAFILTYVSQTRNALLGSLLLFTFAIGMGLLLIFLGTFSNIIVNLEHFNKWTSKVKNILGVAMIFIAFYYVRLILPLHLFNILSGLLIITIGFYIINFTSSRKFLKCSKVFWGSFVIALGIVFTLYPFLFETVRTNINSLLKIEIAQSQNHPDWIHSEKEALEIAKKENKFVMIDFYAEWCVSCIDLDEKTYSNKDVISSLNNFVSVKIDGTKDTQEFQNLAKKYNVIGLPTVIFINKNGQVLENYTITGFKNSVEFLEILEKIKKEI